MPSAPVLVGRAEQRVVEAAAQREVEAEDDRLRARRPRRSVPPVNVPRQPRRLAAPQAHVEVDTAADVPVERHGDAGPDALVETQVEIPRRRVAARGRGLVGVPFLRGAWVPEGRSLQTSVAATI